MKHLLLVSSSKVHGSGYLDHCEAQVRTLFGDAAELLFVPYALCDHSAYATAARTRFGEMDLDLRSVHDADDPVGAVEEAGGVFIGGGNTFRLLKTLQELGLVEPLRRRVLAESIPYMGTSAGSNVAGPTIKTTNDMPIVFPNSFDALGLVPFQINPHYIDPDPESTHMGETRDQRLFEFHEENDGPVVALREGAMLEVRDERVELLGEAGGKLFVRGENPRECAEGTRLDGLVDPES
jgi:dipeptidase E